jgi:hypothetical protein
LSIRVLLQKAIEKKKLMRPSGGYRPIEIPGFDVNGQFGVGYESVYSLQSHLEALSPADLLGKKNRNYDN